MVKQDNLHEKVRHALDTQLSGLVEKPGRAQSILRFAKGEEQPMKRKVSLALVMALTFALALAGVTLAASLGVFGQFAQDENKQQRMETLDSKAETYDTTVEVTPEVEIRPAKEAENDYELLLAYQKERAFTFTLNQAHTAGSSLFVSYTLEGIAPNLTKGEGLPTGPFDWIQEEGQWSDENQLWNNPELQDEAGNWLNAKDGRYIKMDSAGMGDGANLLDGTVLDILDGDTQRLDDNTLQGYMECALPEGLEGDTLTFQVYLIYGSMVVYQDQEGYRTAYVSLPDKKNIQYIPLTISRTGTTVSKTGSLNTDVYSVTAQVFISDIDLQGTAKMEVPQSWTAPWKMLGDGSGQTDYIMDYKLYIGDTPQNNQNGGVLVVDDTHLEISLRYNLPKEGDVLRLVPVYSKTGDHPKEGIELK